MLRQLEFLLQQISENPEAQIGVYSLITPAARQVLPDPAEPLDASWKGAVHELFALPARQGPDQIAVRDVHGTWTYVTSSNPPTSSRQRVWMASSSIRGCRGKSRMTIASGPR